MKTVQVVGLETIESLKNLNKKLDEIRKYTHLASNDLKPNLEKFLANFSTFISNLNKIRYVAKALGSPYINLPEDYEDQIKYVEKEFNEIIKIAKRDARKYRERLIQLRDW